MSQLPPWLEQLVEDAQPCLPERFTGRIELHCSVGAIADVHWHQTAKPKPSRNKNTNSLDTRIRIS